MKLTNISLKAIKGTGERQDLPADGYPGLRLRVAADGTRKTLVYIFRQGGKLTRLTIGDWPQMSLAEAVAIHGKARALALDGDDPRKALPESRPMSRKLSGFTVRDLAEEFRDRHLVPNVKTWRETWRIIEKDILEHWGERDATTIAPREVVLLLDDIMDRGAQRIANRVRSLLVQMFRFGVSRGLVAASPVVAVEPPNRKPASRERILSDAEVRTFWRKIETAKMLPRVTHALRLLLVTGQRRSEVALAAWAEFDLDAKLWTIPAERSKNGKAHIVPLTPMALDILAGLRADLDAAAVIAKRDQDGRYPGRWLFPSPHWEKDEPVDAKAVTRAVSRNRPHWGVDAFTVHDLRRTVRSNLSALGVSPVVAKKVVNHTLEGMDAIYDRHDYLDEKRLALTLWADHLAGIIAGKRAKVTPILRKSAS